MIQIVLIAVCRSSSHVLMWGSGSKEIRATDGKGKAPTSVVRMWLVGLVILGISRARPAGSFAGNIKEFNAPSARRNSLPRKPHDFPR